MTDNSTAPLNQTDRTTLKRLPARGSYERATIDAILDAAPICHLAFIHDGAPFAVPTIHARVEDTVYVHGSVASRMLRSITAPGATVCLTATLLDGLVIARTGFHSSMNYRSVMLLGELRLVTDHDEKIVALNAVVDHVLPGRSSEVRAHQDVELRATTVLALPIVEGSAKVRTGDPIDEPEDMASEVWSGVIPMSLVAGEPRDAADLRAGIAVPATAQNYVGQLRA